MDIHQGMNDKRTVEISGALARGYCSDRNKHKVLDPDLIKAMTEEVNKVVDEYFVMRLAAISTASIQNTEESKKERIGRDNEYWTVAYGDVCTAVDREIADRRRANEWGNLAFQEQALRKQRVAELKALRSRLQELESCLKEAEGIIENLMKSKACEHLNEPYLRILKERDELKNKLQEAEKEVERLKAELKPLVEERITVEKMDESIKFTVQELEARLAKKEASPTESKREALEVALRSAEEKGRREQREKDAKIAELSGDCVKDVGPITPGYPERKYRQLTGKEIAEAIRGGEGL